MTELSDLKVLVVDDEELARMAAHRMLNNLGVREVVEVSDGGHAVSALQEAADSFDIVICDLDMPGIDGIDTLRQLAPLGLRLGVILVSAVDRRVLRTAQEVADGLGLQVLGGVTKPLYAAELADLLESYDQDVLPGRHGGSFRISEEDLHRALQASEIYPVFQPKVRLSDGAMTGVEALARWKHPSKGIIPPMSFIPLAESSGLIDQVADCILTESLEACGAWQAQGVSVNLAVNMSVVSLSRFDLPDMVVSTVEGVGLTSSQLTLEVTESGLLQDGAVPLGILVRLRMKRVGLSIDDFGTGYSSMTRLKKIPFTELKIDRTFVAGSVEDDDNRAILQSSIDLARKLGLTVVAEGVETVQEWDLVRELGCDYVQGYYVARPMAADQLLDWHHEWTGRTEEMGLVGPTSLES